MSHRLKYQITFILFLGYLVFSEYGVYNGVKFYKEVQNLSSKKKNLEKSLCFFKSVNLDVQNNNLDKDLIETRMRYIFGYSKEKEETFFWKDDCGEIFDVYLLND